VPLFSAVGPLTGRGRIIEFPLVVFFFPQEVPRISPPFEDFDFIFRVGAGLFSPDDFSFFFPDTIFRTVGLFSTGSLPWNHERWTTPSVFS